jgi:hypothetical protein
MFALDFEHDSRSEARHRGSMNTKHADLKCSQRVLRMRFCACTVLTVQRDT